MTLKAILFDFNGVIINDEAIHQKLIADILISENLRMFPEDYPELCLGRSDRACLCNILARRGRIVSEDLLQKLLTTKAQAYRSHLESLDTLPIYPVKAFLKKLNTIGLTTGLVTGTLRSEVTWILEQAEIADYFQIIVTGDDITTNQPDSYGYLLAVERFNQTQPSLELQPQNCLVIEDTPAGITAAKNAGMQVVGVANTYPFHMMQRLANWTVDDLGELELDRVQAVFSGGEPLSSTPSMLE
ncbi:MAG: HAD family phosphatase [Jaaginema sp. PMC 1079.18]|nr:HAD family phosphatase [Jaaginema sp. PMC 1080.18]MEC4853731.1 HAD family phosphatase [Jaaginema sp. PMC 1079.18]MEC4869104.1 HAD family phosphatase [Jaaginema sp. PMC 1078.18]